MRIGIVPLLNPQGGGQHQYSLTVIDVIHTIVEQGTGDECILFHLPNQKGYRMGPLKAVHIPITLKDRLYVILSRRGLTRGLIGKWEQASSPDKIRYKPEVNRLFRKHGVGWVFYVTPLTLSFEAAVPFVMPIHDLQHRLQPEFPEVSADGVWEHREYLYRNATRHATLILADSEVGKEDILELYGPYGITADRVKVLPYLYPPYLIGVSAELTPEVRKAYRLPERYLFYPAQFWPHKNHALIVKALGLLKERGIEVHVVFCGNSSSAIIRETTFKEVMALAEKLGVSSQIHYVGRVPDEDMPRLYAGASGLVMPTFFGPTNIPVIEAWAFDCPVLTSDIRGIREQVGDAGLLADPRSEEDLAEKITMLWHDDSLRRALVEKGRLMAASYTVDDFCRRMVEIIDEASERVRQGDSPMPPLKT